VSSPKVTPKMLELQKHRDGLIGLMSGAVFGLVSLVVGHPFDTLKTKMQAQMTYSTGSQFHVLYNVLRREGVIGLYRGCIPPLISSPILRSAQFGAYAEGTPTRSRNDGYHNLFSSSDICRYYLFYFLVYSLTTPKDKTKQPPKILGIDVRILLGGCAGGIARGLIECPFDVAKTTRQTGTSWRLRELTRGLGANIARNAPLLTFFFIFADQVKHFNIPQSLRGFVTGSVCATMAWLLIFPLDVIKSRKQATSGIGKSFLYIVKDIYKSHGIRGFYRGIGPGMVRSLLANGFSFHFYTKTQAFLNKHFLVPKSIETH
jgi:solute carrier family 25 carnitine/acylcarnitine transporter 20/29